MQKARAEARSLEQYESTPTTNHEDQNLFDIDKLSIGAWMRFLQQQSEPIELKLSAKIKEQDKYIFTDRFGRRVSEYNGAQLTSLSDNGQLIVLRQGDNKFESSLEKVVRSLKESKQ